MVLPRILQNVSFRAFYCRYAAKIVLGVQEIVFPSYYILHTYDDAESIFCFLGWFFRMLSVNRSLFLVAGTTEMVGMRILPTSLHWQSSC